MHHGEEGEFLDYMPRNKRGNTVILFMAKNSMNDPVMILQKLESCIGDIKMWMVYQKLKLNDDKSELIVMSSLHNKNEVNFIRIKIGNQILSASSNVRDLGTVTDSVFNTHAHVTSTCKILLLSSQKCWCY